MTNQKTEGERKRFVFSWRGFYYDWWRDAKTDREFKFEMGEDPNDYQF